MIEFKSCFSDYLETFINIYENEGFKTSSAKCALAKLDKYLAEINYFGTELDDDTILNWIKTLNYKNNYKYLIITHYIKFANFLQISKIKAYIPPRPKRQCDFIPYIYSDEEIEKIFYYSDNLTSRYLTSNRVVDFPVVVRILYGCGMRLGETLNLKMKNVDLCDGIFIINHAKNNRQRFVPMDDSLLKVLKKYCILLGRVEKSDEYLFQNRYGKSYTKRRAQDIFEEILIKAQILNEKKKWERGPCLHGLRHSFAYRSFKKNELDGRSFVDTKPFLSTYLGHKNILGTDEYLKFSHSIYDHAHKLFESYTDELFVEVSYEE